MGVYRLRDRGKKDEEETEDPEPFGQGATTR
jgi:hypothetical protein